MIWSGANTKSTALVNMNGFTNCTLQIASSVVVRSPWMYKLYVVDVQGAWATTPLKLSAPTDSFLTTLDAPGVAEIVVGNSIVRSDLGFQLSEINLNTWIKPQLMEFSSVTFTANGQSIDFPSYDTASNLQVVMAGFTNCEIKIPDAMISRGPRMFRITFTDMDSSWGTNPVEVVNVSNGFAFKPLGIGFFELFIGNNLMRSNDANSEPVII